MCKSKGFPYYLSIESSFSDILEGLKRVLDSKTLQVSPPVVDVLHHEQFSLAEKLPSIPNTYSQTVVVEVVTVQMEELEEKNSEIV